MLRRNQWLLDIVLVVLWKRGLDAEIDVRWRRFKDIELLQKWLARKAGDLSANIGGGA